MREFERLSHMMTEEFHLIDCGTFYETTDNRFVGYPQGPNQNDGLLVLDRKMDKYVGFFQDVKEANFAVNLIE